MSQVIRFRLREKEKAERQLSEAIAADLEAERLTITRSAAQNLQLTAPTPTPFRNKRLEPIETSSSRIEPPIASKPSALANSSGRTSQGQVVGAQANTTGLGLGFWNNSNFEAIPLSDIDGCVDEFAIPESRDLDVVSLTSDESSRPASRALRQFHPRNGPAPSRNQPKMVQRPTTALKATTASSLQQRPATSGPDGAELRRPVSVSEILEMRKTKWSSIHFEKYPKDERPPPVDPFAPYRYPPGSWEEEENRRIAAEVDTERFQLELKKCELEETVQALQSQVDRVVEENDRARQQLVSREETRFMHRQFLIQAEQTTDAAVRDAEAMFKKEAKEQLQSQPASRDGARQWLKPIGQRGPSRWSPRFASGAWSENTKVLIPTQGLNTAGAPATLSTSAPLLLSPLSKDHSKTVLEWSSGEVEVIADRHDVIESLSRERRHQQMALAAEILRMRKSALSHLEDDVEQQSRRQVEIAERQLRDILRALCQLVVEEEKNRAVIAKQQLLDWTHHVNPRLQGEFVQAQVQEWLPITLRDQRHLLDKARNEIATADEARAVLRAETERHRASVVNAWRTHLDTERQLREDLLAVQQEKIKLREKKREKKTAMARLSNSQVDEAERIRVNQHLTYIDWALDSMEQKEYDLKRKLGLSTPVKSTRPCNQVLDPRPTTAPNA